MSDCLSNIPGCNRQNFTICTTTFPKDYHFNIRNIQNSLNRQKFHAAFKSNLLWDKGTILRVGFLPNSRAANNCYTLPEDAIKYQPLNPTKSLIPVLNLIDSDPLAIEYSKKWLKADEKDRLGIQIEAVKKVLQRYVGLISIKFEFVNNINDADIKVLFTTDLSAFAIIGKNALGHTTENGENVHFGWFDIATIIHEFNHILGMIHEHQNPIGGISIDWDVQKVYNYFECSQAGWDENTVYNNILKPEDATTINGSCFDPLSIMLYDYPACLTKNNVGTRRNQRLSALDAYWLNKIYGGITSNFIYPSGILSEQSITANKWYDNVYGKNSYIKSLKLSRELRKQYSNQECDDGIDDNWDDNGDDDREPPNRPLVNPSKPYKSDFKNWIFFTLIGISVFIIIIMFVSLQT